MHVLAVGRQFFSSSSTTTATVLQVCTYDTSCYDYKRIVNLYVSLKRIQLHEEECLYHCLSIAICCRLFARLSLQGFYLSCSTLTVTGLQVHYCSANMSGYSMHLKASFCSALT
jgi:hypothetical protein